MILRIKNPELIAKNDGSIYQWNFSLKGEIVLRYRRLVDGGTGIEIPKNNDWHELLKVEAGDKFVVAGNPQPGKPFWALSNRGRDKVAALSVDPVTGQEQIFYEHKEVNG